MFGSIWFANMDCLVGNVKYLHDDGYEYQQPSEPYFTDQSDKSEFGIVNHVKYYDDIGYRASHTTSTNLTGSISKLEHDLVNIKLNDSIQQHHELYTELSK